MSIASFLIRRILYPKSNGLFVLCFVVSAVCYSRAASPLPEDLHNWALASIEKIYIDDLKSSEEYARKIMRKYPDHPAGYFLMASVVDSWMVLHQSDKKENEFYRYCDLAIEKGERLLDKNPADEWARFFKGGADGYKGTYEARYERWITAFRYGWKGVSVLLDLDKDNSDIEDIKYGIGCYDYWRSALMKVLWFMPGIEDKREIGIQKLLESRVKGVYTRNASAVALIDIYLNEDRFEEAEGISEEMLKKFPGYSAFMWGMARSLYGLKRYDESAKVFRSILSKVEADPQDNHYDAAICHLWLAKIELAQGRYSQAIAECNRMGYYEFDDNIKKRLDKQLSEANSINKQALSKQARAEGKSRRSRD